ncbi:class I adenylate-forming enzyme family protein [Cytophaga aurantiaca]|uniref:class I adenylate-forming enzyme family protein n=1 Tax=Cytophaga aurantiaca TaxID=29530 RepID=UPI00036D8DB0|nr:class I adenylate-forming enzyme family protein [Cytophaga aurantiaca]
MIKINHSYLSKHFIDDVPSFENIVFFDKRKKVLTDTHENFYEEIREKTKTYKSYIEQKCRRPFVDIYASFQPFNEATKALLPFLELVKTKISSEEKILILWDRSGWITSLVSGIFPENEIITTWEGNKDVLGHAGFTYWFKNRTKNTIVFCDHTSPFPIEDASVSLIIGLDLLHRFDQTLLLKEVLRMSKKDGAIIFPHVHLSNSEPVPYFDRGGHQLHGEVYQKTFDQIAKHGTHNGYIFSEPDLFQFNDLLRKEHSRPLVSDYNTKDYNALAALLPKSWSTEVLKPYKNRDEIIASCRILINPLLRVEQDNVILDYNALDKQVGYLLERHIPYLPKIEKADKYVLNDVQMKLLYWSSKSLTLKQISERISISINDLISEADALKEIGLIEIFPISEKAHQQQNFIGSQKLFVPYSDQTFASQWQQAVDRYKTFPALLNEDDGSVITFAESDEIVQSIIQKLSACGLNKGNSIVLVSPIHTEAILLAWACLSIGVILVPVNYKASKKDIEYILSIAKPTLIFKSTHVPHENIDSNHSIPLITFDETDEAEGNDLFFSDWLETEEQNYNSSSVTHTSDAVLLFSSGSTGVPKGIALSQGHLIRSAWLMAQTYDWNQEDIFLAIGGLESMSGFRNACIVPVISGTAICVPSYSTIQNAVSIAACISKNEVSILVGNPALYNQFNTFQSHIQNQLVSLKKVLCTGSKLSAGVRAEFLRHYNKAIYNYYGLTETTGLCIAELLGNTADNKDAIGLPIDALIQIVDTEGKPAAYGEPGELRLYSENIFQGYYQREDLTALCMSDGWFYTGDIATMDASGQVHLVGRAKELIKTSTDTLVYLEPIAELIEQHPSIEFAAVVGYVEDETEKMAAFVVAKNDSGSDKELITELRGYIEKEAGKDKLPSRIIFKKELPYTSNGKIIKHLLVEEIYAN